MNQHDTAAHKHRQASDLWAQVAAADDNAQKLRCQARRVSDEAQVWVAMRCNPEVSRSADEATQHTLDPLLDRTALELAHRHDLAHRAHDRASKEPK